MGTRAFVDLHCHTRASFDSLADPAAVMRAAVTRGLTHLAITDHHTIDGALEAREHAPDGLHVIVGEEIRTAEGDLIALFLEEAIQPGLPAQEAITAIRDQGGLVGLPHPYDRWRGSMLRDVRLEILATSIDWVESHNARVVGGTGNEKAAEFAREHGLPGVSVSDAHSVLEVGVAYTVLDGDPSTPEGLRTALHGSLDVIAGRASYVARGITPIAKAVNRLRGRRPVAPSR
jgi:predicted metal-dependent phosphoesterase TrpH